MSIPVLLYITQYTIHSTQYTVPTTEDTKIRTRDPYEPTRGSSGRDMNEHNFKISLSSVLVSAFLVTVGMEGGIRTTHFRF